MADIVGDDVFPFGPWRIKGSVSHVRCTMTHRVETHIGASIGANHIPSLSSFFSSLNGATANSSEE